MKGSNMISKELLSEVLGFEVYEYYIQSVSLTCAKVNGSSLTTINVYELAHKCKEWLYSKGYSVSILLRVNGLNQIILASGIDMDERYKSNEKEPEHILIFKACEWVLENKQ